MLNTGMHFDSICSKTLTSLLILSTDSIFICILGGRYGVNLSSIPVFKIRKATKAGGHNVINKRTEALTFFVQL